MGALSNFRRKLAGHQPPDAPGEAAPIVPQDVAAVVPQPPPSLVCRPARREEISLGLRVVLGSAGHPADDGQVLDFMQFALRRGISLADLWLAVDTADGTLLWAVLPVVSPGRTLLLLGPSHPSYRAGGRLAAVADALVESVCQHFAGRDVQLAQVLFDPNDRGSHGLYAGRGFLRVAELLYLQATPRRKAATAPPPAPAGFSWSHYGPDTHDRFAAAIADSYRQSLDCPALNGVRDMEDVLAGHKASGEFDPALWLLLSEQVDGADPIPRGVLLLSRAAPGDAIELVYLGLTPAARGRGLGDLLVRRALASAAALGPARLSLAVDSQNGPALKLYYRHGLQRVASKLAMMRLLNGRHPAPPAPPPAPPQPVPGGA